MRLHSGVIRVVVAEDQGMVLGALASRIQAERLPVRVLIVTTFGRPGYLRRALAAGRRVVASELAEAAWRAVESLSERELAVLRLAEEGRSNKDIANTLGLAHGTLRIHLHEAAQKLGADNRVETTRIARANGL